MSAPAPAPAPPAAPAPAALASDGQPIPASQGVDWYFDRPIQEADLKTRSLRELSLIRNTIFARAGNPFRKQWLNEYFRAQPWYRPLAQVDSSKLTALDMANSEVVATFENKLPQTTLEQRRDATLQRLRQQPTPEDAVEIVLLARALGENAWSYGLSGVKLTQEMALTALDDPSQLDRLLTVDQLTDLSRRDLRLLRNTVYARHGRPFTSELLTMYFDNKSWYSLNPAYTDALLTDIDKRNIQMIRSVEDSIGGPITDYEHKSENGWFVAA